MQHEIHHAEQVRQGLLLDAAQVGVEFGALRCTGDLILQFFVGLEEEAASPAGRVENRFAELQAKRYARLLEVPFAYATNGTEIFEVDRNNAVCR